MRNASDKCRSWAETKLNNRDISPYCFLFTFFFFFMLVIRFDPVQSISAFPVTLYFRKKSINRLLDFFFTMSLCVFLVLWFRVAPVSPVHHFPQQSSSYTIICFVSMVSTLSTCQTGSNDPLHVSFFNLSWTNRKLWLMLILLPYSLYCVYRLLIYTSTSISLLSNISSPP